MKTTTLIMMAVAAWAGTLMAGVPERWDAFNYPNGMDFQTTPTNGWQASGTSAFVTNSGGYGDNGNAAVLAGAVLLTNALNADNGLSVWTDFRITPVLGPIQDAPSTNTSSFHAYFNPAGYLVVAGPTGWTVYSNDVWGAAVPPATNGYVRLSIWQNYGSSTQAFFLNEHLVAQDLRFVGGVNAYSNLVFQGDSGGSAWLDNVRVTTNFSLLGMSSNLNGDAMADALEVQTYGYAMRTLHVVASAQPGPYFTTLQAAVNVWRPRDIISIDGGSQAGESVTISGSGVVITGNALSLAGLTVASGASVTVSQSVYCAGTLAVTGQMAMASGLTLTSATATVAGTLTLPGGTLQAGSLAITGAGQVNGTGTHLVVPGSGVDMTSTFSLTAATWGNALVSMPLPFADTFDEYATGTVVTNLKFRGWNATAGSVTLQSGTKRSAPNAVSLPAETTLSNSLSTAATKTWTDFYLDPVPGDPPSAPETNDSSFLAYVNTSGYLVAAVAGGGWVVCSNNAVAMQTNRFSRVTVMQDLAQHTFAVFVDSNLVAQGLSAPVSLANFKSLVVQNPDVASAAYVDDVLISTNVPPGMSSDATEINLYGQTIRSMTAGSVFKIR